MTFKAGALAVGLAVVGACGGPPPEPAPAPDVDPVAKVQAWRDKHEADYLRDWVSIAGLHMLEPGIHTVGSGTDNAIVIPNLPGHAGAVTLSERRLTFTAAAGIRVVRKDQALASTVVLKEPGKPAEPEIAIGQVRLVAHESGDRVSLRVRDPNGEWVRSFRGFTWFPIDEAYRVTARFVPDATPRRLKVGNTFGDLDEYTTEGVVEFSLHGQTVRLRPFTTRPKRFYFVFRDASSGQETYKTARFLYADLLDDGTSVLDFNQAYNPPCAFNPYTTCPIPLPENVLPVKVLAGERAYPIDVPLTLRGGKGPS